ncbi:hypothetical protein [Streptomyces formicae]|uniref:Uncharacterized protein n=1 Tax=Streptomyces formicae TaxID=1616117 RepID=A0ABY3WIA7_9ACTN|nr:hypothetical protein [Streptomyces formicae]UNM12318.1 hypothetical protein J4032_12935 [Streptomyces formicae]
MEFELIDPEQQTFFSHARAQRAAKEERDPVIGDIVHFWDDGACRAALVLDTDGQALVDGKAVQYLDCLRIMRPTKGDEERWCAHDETKAVRSWHWPCGGR